LLCLPYYVGQIGIAPAANNKQYLFILPPKADDPDNKKQGNNTKQRSIQSIMSLTHQFS
jgi:hypothetical protein